MTPKEKAMKTTFRFTMVMILSFVVLYLAWGFAHADWNFYNWSIGSRIFLIFCYACTTLPCTAIADYYEDIKL